MNSYHFSAMLYDWCLVSEEYIIKLLGQCKMYKSPLEKVYVQNKDTLAAVEEAYNKHGEEIQIGWINLANAHNVGGAYNRSFGSQEENTVTHSTGIVSLTLHAEPEQQHLQTWFHQNCKEHMTPVKYRQNHHIPPGGVYICKTKLLNTEKCINCLMIGMASADFRETTSYRQEAESNQFPTNSDKYNMRIMLDLEAVCLGALQHGVDYLILGATGCGAFKHDAKIEAMLWYQVLSKYGCYFKKIIFAIKEDRSGYNIKSFEKVFPDKE